MTVKELIEELQKYSPDLQVIGYAELDGRGTFCDKPVVSLENGKVEIQLFEL